MARVNLMAPGDILLLATDGLFEHSDGEVDFVPDQLQETVRRVKNCSAKEIVAAIREGAPLPPRPARPPTPPPWTLSSTPSYPRLRRPPPAPLRPRAAGSARAC